MRVLVTGSKGYIGCVLTRLLLKRGHDVVGMDTDLYERCTFGSPDDLPTIRTLAKDIRDVESGDLRGFDAVLHLAGLSNDPLGDLDPDLTLEINHLASVRLAEIAKSVGVARYVFSSSCSNYGGAGDDLIDEDAEFNPVTPYGRSKVLVEQDLAPMADERFTPVILRSSTAYGVSPRLRFDLVLNNLTAWAFTTGKIMLKSDGSPWRPIVHIEDISRAFAAALEAPTDIVRGQCFNVGTTSENYRIRELAEIVGETVPGSVVTFADGAAPDMRNYRVSCDKLAATFPDFAPRWTARAGATELYEAYKRVGLTLDEFEGPRYRRVDHIRMLVERGVLDSSLRRTASRPVDQPPRAKSR